MNNLKITFIGGGNMASAIIGGLLDGGLTPDHLHVVDPAAAVQQRLSEKSIRVQTHIDASVFDASVLVLAIKPQIMPEVLATLAGLWPNDKTPLIISIASGVTFQTMTAAVGQQAMVRCMPNTPALVGAGISALVANDQVTPAHKEMASHLLQQVGQCVWLEDESMLDLVTAISGSGPAYFFALAEHLIDAAQARGMDKALAQRLVHQTAFGAGKMLIETTADAGTLRTNVTSPGGTTEAALNVFTQADLSSLVDQVVEAAWRRAQALGADSSQSSAHS